MFFFEKKKKILAYISHRRRVDPKQSIATSLGKVVVSAEKDSRSILAFLTEEVFHPYNCVIASPCCMRWRLRCSEQKEESNFF